MKRAKPIVCAALFIALLTTTTYGQEMAITPKLQDQLDEVKAQAAKKFPAEMMAKFSAATAKLKASGIEGSAKQVGSAAVDATLTDAAGKSVQLSQLWAKGPVVLMWYRGGW